MVTQEEVHIFLNKFKQLAKTPDRLILLRKYPGSKNLECILELGITERKAKEIVLGLSVKDYSKGPEEDRDREGQEIWVFCPYFESRAIYVKVVISKTEDGYERPKILSFHFPEYPLKKPFDR